MDALSLESIIIFADTFLNGDVAQVVEQRTENPCVGGSNPSITTHLNPASQEVGFFVFRNPKHEQSVIFSLTSWHEFDN